ncbi:unnamed protein product [Leptosia nina]|uniref:Uncharacterized protein n=1 Tax=Leptosia nina TaxID=320188 RepID=A0AAV1J2D3_9NEOP
MWAVSVVWVTTVNLILASAQSSEDLTTYTGAYTHYPSTVNFHDIYSNNLLNEKEETTEDLNTIPSQFVEFHPRLLKISPITPAPRLLLNSRYLKKNDEATTDAGPTTTEEPEPIKVIPIRNHHRGVLDVLFPAARVRTFKNIFDTFRRVLSYTF